MCVDGINSSQLKLSLHQTIEMGNLLQKIIHQWGHLIEHSGHHEITKELESSEEHIKKSCQKIEQILDKIDEHYHGEDEVTVKKV